MSKYKIGQGVYLIVEDENYGECVVNPDLLCVAAVYKISDSVCQSDIDGIWYSLTTPDDEAIDWCKEEDIFFDRDEAIKEARGRNKIETIGV